MLIYAELFNFEVFFEDNQRVLRVYEAIFVHIGNKRICALFNIKEVLENRKRVFGIDNSVVVHIAGTVAEFAEHCDIIALFGDVGQDNLAVLAELCTSYEYQLAVNRLVEVRKLAFVFFLKCDFKTCGNARIVNLELRSLSTAQSIGFCACCLYECKVSRRGSCYIRTFNCPRESAVDNELNIAARICNGLDYINGNRGIAVKLDCCLGVACKFSKVCRNIAPAL